MDLKFRRSIWVTWQAEGTHNYPLAKTSDKLKDVAFLGDTHRHMFHFRVEIDVFEDDREIEFIQFKRNITNGYGQFVPWGAMSCEMIAAEIATWVNKHYPGRSIMVTVAEDGENGATVVYDEPKMYKITPPYEEAGRAETPNKATIDAMEEARKREIAWSRAYDPKENTNA